MLLDFLNHLFVYIDDNPIFSKTGAEHMVHLRPVLTWLVENGLFVKAKKDEFHSASVPFLGLKREGLKVDPEKIRVVVGWPLPETRKVLQ